jgi:Cu(I)/Ag(I) efflux system protein CusF
VKAFHTFIAAALLASAGAYAQQASPASQSTSKAGSTAATPQSEGEVRKVDLEQGKVTLRHGPLANLDMPSMTMVFTAADPKLLQGLKQGDKVRFTADKKDGTYVVTAIETAK